MTRERVRLMEVGWAKELVHEVLDEEPAPPTGKLVSVAVEACGVCHRDVIDREGRFPFLRVPVVPGHEVAGRVIAVGEAVTDWKAGDRVGSLVRDACGACGRCLAGDPAMCERAAWVLGLMCDGGYASQLEVPESALYALPEGLPAEEAAVLACTAGTAYRDLRTLGRLEAGERVLVTGANGGVGSAAIQVARRLGAHVVAAVRDERHRAHVVEMGAHEVVTDIARAGKVDLVLEAVGQPTFAAALRALRIGGRMVVPGNVTADKVALNLGYLITYGISIIGARAASRRDMAELLAIHAREPLHVPIERVMPLSHAEEAQRAVKAGGRRGRIVLRPSA